MLDELTIKPKAGFGAAVSAALCPNPKVGLGASVGSAGFPKVNAGLGISFGGSGLLKEKPKEWAGLSASFAALNTNPVEGRAASFFSSGLPNVKVEVANAGSFADGSPNNGAAVLGSDTAGLRNTGMVLVAVVEEAETPVEGGSSFSDLALSAEESNSKLLLAVLASESLGFGCSKEKPPVTVVEVLADVEPKVTPLLPPNLKPVLELVESFFFSAFVDAGAAPNLKPSEDPPNVNPSEEVVLVEEESTDVPPNLKPPVLSAEEAPNLKPPELEVESEVLPILKSRELGVFAKLPPNFSPTEVALDEPVPNLNVEELESVLDDCVPKEDTKPLDSTFAPGLGDWQATQSWSTGLF